MGSPIRLAPPGAVDLRHSAERAVYVRRSRRKGRPWADAVIVAILWGWTPTYEAVDGLGVRWAWPYYHGPRPDEPYETLFREGGMCQGPFATTAEAYAEMGRALSTLPPPLKLIAMRGRWTAGCGPE